jgi:hypothetical protein
MTNGLETGKPRRLSCARCGTSFSCDAAGACWCREETVRLPMPSEGQDCLCRTCLTELAAAQAASLA